VESNSFPKGFTILKYKVSTSVLWVEVSLSGGGFVQELSSVNIKIKNRYLKRNKKGKLEDNEGIMD
jgi:hypothetical protein